MSRSNSCIFLVFYRDSATWDSYIQVCTVDATIKRLNMFGMKSDGTCLDEDTSLGYTTKDGFSLKCISAKGAVEQYFVFKFHTFT